MTLQETILAVISEIWGNVWTWFTELGVLGQVLFFFLALFFICTVYFFRKGTGNQKLLLEYIVFLKEIASDGITQEEQDAAIEKQGPIMNMFKEVYDDITSGSQIKILKAIFKVMFTNLQKKYGVGNTLDLLNDKGDS